MEGVGFAVGEVDDVLDDGGHQGVVDDEDPLGNGREGLQEGEEGLAEGGGGLEGREKVGGEPCVGVRGRGRERGELEVMNVDVGEVVALAAAMGTEEDLAVVGGGAHEVDGDVAGEEEAGEVEELVQVALGGEGDHHRHHLLAA